MLSEKLYKYLFIIYQILDGSEHGDVPVPNNTTEELIVSIIKKLDGDIGVDVPEPSSNIDRFLVACLDVMSGYKPTIPARSWNIEKFLYAAIEALSGNEASTPVASWSHEQMIAAIVGLASEKYALPDGYKRVLGFQCNNNAMWEITDFHLKGSDTVRASFSVTAACNVWGCYHSTSATNNYDLYVATATGAKYLRYGNKTYPSSFVGDDLDKRFDCVFTPTGTQGMPVDSEWEELEFEATNDLMIGSTSPTSSSAKLRGNFYGDFIVENDNGERLHLVPCERLSDHVLGYYDTIGETFYEPSEGYDGAVSLGYYE